MATHITLLLFITLMMATNSHCEGDAAFSMIFGALKAPWTCPHAVCPMEGHEFSTKQNLVKHVTSIQQHTYCYVSQCDVCNKLETGGLFRGERPVPVADGVKCGHTDCARTFVMQDRSGKSHHLKNHVRCKRPCSLCAKCPADEPPGK